MVIVADENIDKAIIVRLRLDGHQVIAIAESFPAIDDSTVLGIVKEQRALLLTEDKDFVEMIFLRQEYRYGVVLVRLDGCSSAQKASLASMAINEHGHELPVAIAALTPHQFRIRKLTITTR